MGSHLFGAGLTLAACYGFGLALTRRMSLEWPVRLALGACVFSLLLFALMMVHQATRPLIGLLAGIAALPAVLSARKIRFPSPPWWVLALFVPFAVYGFVNALAPEIEADPNTYHLQPAVDASLRGGFSAEISFYERLPQGVELLYVPAFLFGGAPSAKLVHFGFLLATLPLILQLGRAFELPDTAAFGAALLYFLAPVVQVSGASAFNDAALVFAGMATLTALANKVVPAWVPGVLAGFCFWIKMTGGIVIVVGLIWLIAQRRYSAALIFTTAASAVAVPWAGRNLLQTGNPFAPFFNRWFPNKYFHPSTEQQLAVNLRSYGVEFWQRFPQALWGWRLHGMIGPVFALSPLALLAVRRRNSATLLALALVLSVPWWLNAGTRFLTLALPPFALALLTMIPRSAVIPLLAVHALTVWPAAIPLYSPHTWRLHQFPWKVAVGLERPDDYLQRTSWDYRVARMVEQHTSPSNRILDLAGVHAAHIRRSLTGSWQSALGENAMRTLAFALRPGEEKLYALRAYIAPQPIRGIRIRQTATSGSLWSLSEVELIHNGERVRQRATWFLDAKPNRWETPFAMDGNLASRWITWQPARPRQFFSLDLGGTEQVDKIEAVGTRWDGGTRMELEVQVQDGRWVGVDSTESEFGPLNLRRESMRQVRRLGFTHIVGRADKEGIGQLGSTLANDSAEWGAEVVDNYDAVYLFRIR